MGRHKQSVARWDLEDALAAGSPFKSGGQAGFLRRQHWKLGLEEVEEQLGDQCVWGRETVVADKVREIPGTQNTQGPVGHLIASALTLDERRTF